MLSSCVFPIILLATPFLVLSSGAPVLPIPWPQTQQFVLFLQDYKPIGQHEQHLEDVKTEHHNHHSDGRASHHRYEPGNIVSLYDNDDNYDDEPKARFTRSLPETNAYYMMDVLSQLSEIYTSASPLRLEARIHKEAYHQLIQSRIIMQNSTSAISTDNKNQPWYQRWFSWNFGRDKETISAKEIKFIIDECITMASSDSENSDGKPDSKSIFFTITQQPIVTGRAKSDGYQNTGSNQLGMLLQRRSAKNDAVMQVITSDVMF